MTIGISRTALSVKLERYEVEALLDWHISEKHRCADKEEFTQAEDHRKRAFELGQLLSLPLEAE